MEDLSATIVLVLLLTKSIDGSFWNSIPTRCIYDRTTLLSCRNTTFRQPIPLFNDLTYTLQNHHVDIRHSNFHLSLVDLFEHVASAIVDLTLIDNGFASGSTNGSQRAYFRLLQSLDVHDSNGLQWSQLNASFYPQLLRLDLSFNRFTSDDRLRFNEDSFPELKSLNLSYNRLQSIDHLTGNVLSRIESLTLAFNPLESILGQLDRFASLKFLDLSSTLIKQLGPLTVLTRLETLVCRRCEHIVTDNLLENCSQLNNHLRLDLSETPVASMNVFNPHVFCIKELVVNRQRSLSSITAQDLVDSRNLERIEIREVPSIDFVHINVYDRLKFIDLSGNEHLNQLTLHLMSNYTSLQLLSVSRTMTNDLFIYFLHTSQEYLHADIIDLSHCRFETLPFLQHLTFHTLDVSYNRLKILDIDPIHFRHGMYDLSQMNLFNLSSNQLESVRIHWDEESPHTIDLSGNRLQSIELHGQSTYAVRLNSNVNLSITSKTFALDLPALQFLDLTATRLTALENLIYLHNLSNIHTLILDHNQLDQHHRTLNWQIFSPWRRYLSHVSLRNISLEQIDLGAYLDDYYHLLTIDLFGNRRLPCDCRLQPFVHWLQHPPPPIPDFNEPLQKLLHIECPRSILDLHCNDGKQSPTTGWLVVKILVILGAVLVALVVVNFFYRYERRKSCRSYHRIFTDADIILLNERNTLNRTDDE